MGDILVFETVLVSARFWQVQFSEFKDAGRKPTVTSTKFNASRAGLNKLLRNRNRLSLDSFAIGALRAPLCTTVSCRAPPRMSTPCLLPGWWPGTSDVHESDHDRSRVNSDCEDKKHGTTKSDFQQCQHMKTHMKMPVTKRGDHDSMCVPFFESSAFRAVSVAKPRWWVNNGNN